MSGSVFVCVCELTCVRACVCARERASAIKVSTPKQRITLLCYALVTGAYYSVSVLGNFTLAFMTLQATPRKPEHILVVSILMFGPGGTMVGACGQVAEAIKVSFDVCCRDDFIISAISTSFFRQKD